MEKAIYPIDRGERELPFYIYGIGFNDWQYDVNRENGYPTHQIIYCTKGKGRVVIDGKETIITSGMCFFLPAKYPHEYYTIGDLWETYWIAFDGYETENTLKKLGFDKAKVFALNSLEGMEEQFRKIFLTLNTDHIFGNFAASGMLYSFILEFHRAAFDKNAEQGAAKETNLMSVLDYIDENFSRDIELEELCGIAKITPQHLCRIFKKQLDMRPMEYIAKKRIQNAKSLLLTTDKTVSEIAAECGYHDVSYFGMLFRKWENMTPGEYRRLCR